MTAQGPGFGGLLGRVHDIIDPVRAMGGYGNAALLVMPGTRPNFARSGILGQMPMVPSQVGTMTPAEVQALHFRGYNPGATDPDVRALGQSMLDDAWWAGYDRPHGGKR